MRFNLNFNPPKPGFTINHGHRLFLTGSCFSENIFRFLTEKRFKAHPSPNGIVFNPDSICRNLQTLIMADKLDEKFILNRNGIFFSFLHHSSVHDESRSDLVKKINHDLKTASLFLKTANFLVITFGSAYAYKHVELNSIVANCHKQPGQVFEKILLTPEKIQTDFAALIRSLQTFNPTLKIIFTVSPVKYLKDGIIENNLSKATLLLSVHEIVKSHSNCCYFPAFELVNDDLRDYRFYKEDLAHPNEQAIAYVWEKFSETFFSDHTLLLNQEINKLNSALNHRRLINNSEEAIKLNNFILKQKEVIKTLDASIQL